MCWTPHATVATIIERDGKFLMVEEQADGGIRFNQPAGHIEDKESMFEAARRETLEESAYDVQLDYLVGVYIYRAPSNQVTYHRYCFAGTLRDFHPELTLDKDIIRTHWLTRNEIAARSSQLRGPLVLTCIDDYLAGKNYPLTLVTEMLSP